MMPEKTQFKAAFAYQDDVLTLPVTSIEAAATWYAAHFGMVEVERHEGPMHQVILERDSVRLGFAVNGGDASQDGAAILVAGISELRHQIEASGIAVGDLGVEERDGQQLQVFFVVAPDGLCYYFHEPMERSV